MESLLNHVNKEWIKHSDIHWRDFPLLDSPFYFLTGIIVSLLTIQSAKILQSKVSSSLKSSSSGSVKSNGSIDSKTTSSTSLSVKKDIRPILLIHDGFCFGVYGIGVFMIYTVADFGRMFYTCNYSYPITDFHTQAVVHLIYVYLLISFVCYGHPLIQVLGGHPVDVLVDLVHHSIWSCLLTVYMVFNPIGLSLVVPIIDCISKCVHYGSSVLAVTDPDSSVAAKWSNLCRTLTFAAIAGHSYLFNLYAGSCSKPTSKSIPYENSVLLITCVYASTVAVVSFIRFLVAFSPFFSASSIEKQVLSSGRTLRKNVRLTNIPVTMMK